MLGISVDHVPCLKSWSESLGGVSYPLLSDFWPHGRVAELYGVLRPEGYSERAIFVIDRDGVICSTEVYDLDYQPENQDLWRVLERLEPGYRENTPEVKPQPVKPQPVEPLPKVGIVMYCTPWCPDCRRARQWMLERGLKWTEVNVMENPAVEAQVKAWGNGYRITPTFDIDGTIVLDFKIDQLEAALQARRTP